MTCVTRQALDPRLQRKISIVTSQANKNGKSAIKHLFIEGVTRQGSGLEIAYELREHSKRECISRFWNQWEKDKMLHTEHTGWTEKNSFPKQIFFNWGH